MDYIKTLFVKMPGKFVNGTGGRFTKRERSGARRVRGTGEAAALKNKWGAARKVLITALGAGLFLGIVGPFGTFLNQTMEVRIAYWMLLLGVGTLIFPFLYQLIQRRKELAAWPSWARVIAVSALGALPMMIVVSGATYLFYGTGIPIGLILYGVTVVVAVPVVLVHHLVVDRAGPVTAPPAENLSQSLAETRRNVLLERLGGVTGADILCLQVEDHYVRVHTIDNSHMVLMRFSDAIASIQDVEGIQVHRSWWVAQAAVHTVHRTGRKLEIELHNGLRVPVSREGKRTYLASVEKRV